MRDGLVLFVFSVIADWTRIGYNCVTGRFCGEGVEGGWVFSKPCLVPFLVF